MKGKILVVDYIAERINIHKEEWRTNSIQTTQHRKKGKKKREQDDLKLQGREERTTGNKLKIRENKILSSQ
jgi:hypothetical protein